MKRKRIYLYSAYERIWHWAQAAIMILLIVTGFEIHSPDTISWLSFETAVRLHTVLGFLLLANAFLGLFYHLTTGAIRQYIPEPRDFVSLAWQQALFYLLGIFRGEPHPIEKSRSAKLNPLQRITYLVILNLLLPLQVVTGLLIWGATEWPTLRSALGGLPVLAPIHTLGAWIFLAFVVLHVYLTTTGSTPLSSIRAMVTGWEEVEDGQGPGPEAARPIASAEDSR